MANHDVLIAGGGPTGLMLAAELALGGLDVAVVERRENQELPGRRAGGLHARTIEEFDQRGIAERFLALGKPAQFAGFNMVRLDIADFPSRHPYGLPLTQNLTERVLAAWVAELGVWIIRGRTVTGFTQDGAGVDVGLDDGTSLRGAYLVGCDGGRSLIRKAAGIDFPGWDPTTSWLMAEVEMTEKPKLGFHKDALGVHAIGPLENGHTMGVVLTEGEVISAEPTLADVKAALIAAYGTDFGAHSPTWLSRFTDVARQAARYRAGRVLLAGDAAHIHPPMGGQGLNIGVQDAVNLGWKLAQVVKGVSSESLLDTYHAERHPVAARVLRSTMAQVALRRTDDRTQALSDIVAELLATDEARKRLGAEMSGLGINYDLGPGHPLLGRRMPDLHLVTPEGPARLFTFLHKAHAVFLNLNGMCDIGPWAARVQQVNATYTGAWDLPVIGAVNAPTAVLIRPDGYVAWVGEGTDAGLTDALTKWFGDRIV